ncbi:SRPBCC domain-containing protein [Achromobacter pestifer]
MEFTNKFHVPLPMDEAWKLMLDVPRILPCLPGARLTEVLGNNKYRGSVSVRLGPIKLAFDGQAELVRTDEEAHIAWLQGSGLDPKGRGGAQSEFSFALTPAEAGGTDVTVVTQLVLSGSVAQYGRGSGMIAEVASQILGQFEQNLGRLLDDEAHPEGGQQAFSAAQTSPASATGMPAASAGAPALRPAGPGASAAGSADSQAVLQQAQAVLCQAQAVLALAQTKIIESRGRPARPAPKAAELNMLSIGLKALWSRIKYGVAGLFGRRSD